MARGAGESAAHVYFADRAALRQWLTTHHAEHGPIWLVYDKKSAGGKGAGRALSYDDIVEEALCFGWIDSVAGRVDERQAKLYFSPRRPRGVWSARNKRIIETLVARGLMMPAGLAAIERAKANGAWSALNAAEALEMPADLAAEFARHPKARANYDAFPPGARKQVLLWVTSAKRAQTRADRVKRAVALAGKNVRASAATGGATAATRGSVGGR